MTVVRPQRTQQYDAVDVGADVLLYDGSTLQLLEGVAAWLWHELDGSRTAEQLASHAAAHFRAPSEEVRRDVVEFLHQLEIRGMLHERAGVEYVVPLHVGWVVDWPAAHLVDLTSGCRRTLTQTGADIWTQIAAHGRLEPTVDALATLYPDAPARLRDDVLGLLDHLVVEQWLETAQA